MPWPGMEKLGVCPNIDGQGYVSALVWGDFLRSKREFPKDSVRIHQFIYTNKYRYVAPCWNEISSFQHSGVRLRNTEDLLGRRLFNPAR